MHPVDVARRPHRAWCPRRHSRTVRCAHRERCIEIRFVEQGLGAHRGTLAAIPASESVNLQHPQGYQHENAKLLAALAAARVAARLAPDRACARCARRARRPRARTRSPASSRLYSEYEYRGISQTSEKPALQLNLDYAHASGFYIGTFLINIKWLKDTADVGGFATDAQHRVGHLRRLQVGVRQGLDARRGLPALRVPELRATFNPKPNTDEVYVGVS